MCPLRFIRLSVLYCFTSPPGPPIGAPPACNQYRSVSRILPALYCCHSRQICFLRLFLSIIFADISYIYW
ncbi:MAG: hypothetical protein DU429_03260 [Candidatus Tokpelaia sp.]|nr:MAG: hypothetical protein DU430_01120 [Candidatus Tokpelaia sp.]KAA6207137.1 MAG: hypothetical protein DU429_03260 [Candidatus Tokpelaia sp.]